MLWTSEPPYFSLLANPNDGVVFFVDTTILPRDVAACGGSGAAAAVTSAAASDLTVDARPVREEPGMTVVSREVELNPHAGALGFTLLSTRECCCGNKAAATGKTG